MMSFDNLPTWLRLADGETVMDWIKIKILEYKQKHPILRSNIGSLATTASLESYFWCWFIYKMASRGGVMVTGTNGLDYEHREKVAAQYQLRWVWGLFLIVLSCKLRSGYVTCAIDIAVRFRQIIFRRKLGSVTVLVPAISLNYGAKSVNLFNC